MRIVKLTLSKQAIQANVNIWNQNLDKKKKAKLDSTARTHFVPEDRKYPFKGWKVLSANQQKQGKEVHRKCKNSTQNSTINATQTP